MKLLRLRMHGFRSYAEPTEIVFAPGLNVFQGRNEAGKTGILLAVQSALFAPRLASDREALVTEGSEVCRIELEYELPGGRRFRVERDLVDHRGAIAEWRDGAWVTLATAVGDIARVVREHTGCDEPLFRASLLVRHEAIEVGDGADLTRALNERLEVLVSGSPGGVTAARAVRALDERMKKLSGPRAGLIAAAHSRLREAEARLESARSTARRLEGGQPRLAELAAHAEKLAAELADAAAVLARARRAVQLEAGRDALRARRAAIDRALDARADLTRLEIEARAARALIPATAPPIAVPLPRWPFPAMAAGLALLAVGIAVFFLASRPLGGAAFFIGAAILGAGVLGNRRPAPIPALATEHPAERAAREAERRRDIAEGAAASLDQRPDEELTAERARLGRDLEEAEAAVTEAALHRLEPTELARLDIAVQQLPEKIRAAENARVRAEVELDQLREGTLSPAELEDEAQVAQADVDRLELRLAATTLARDQLEGAVRDIRDGVGPQLADAASRVLDDVAPGHLVALSDGPGLGFTATGPSGAELGRRELSDGTQDQFHFAVRLALADVLLGELRPPLLLDDPFRYADSERRAALHQQLARIAEQRQVLYFTVATPAELPVTHALPLAGSRVGR